jgi:hypothetical protein
MMSEEGTAFLEEKKGKSRRRQRLEKAEPFRTAGRQSRKRALTVRGEGANWARRFSCSLKTRTSRTSGCAVALRWLLLGFLSVKFID